MISLSGISYLSTCFPYVFFNPNPPPWTCYWLQQQHQSNLLIYMQKKQQKKIVTRITIGNESFAYKIHFSAFVSKMDATNLGSIGWFACINIVSTMSLEITQSSFSAAFISCCCSWTHHHRSKIPTLRLKTHCGVRTLLWTVANSRSEISGANYLKNNNIIDYHTYKIKI